MKVRMLSFKITVAPLIEQESMGLKVSLLYICIMFLVSSLYLVKATFYHRITLYLFNDSKARNLDLYIITNTRFKKYRM